MCRPWRRKGQGPRLEAVEGVVHDPPVFPAFLVCFERSHFPLRTVPAWRWPVQMLACSPLFVVCEKSLENNEKQCPLFIRSRGQGRGPSPRAPSPNTTGSSECPELWALPASPRRGQSW